MEKKIKQQELTEKIMKGLHIAAKKLLEQSIRDKQPLVISIGNKIEKIYPPKAV